MRTAQRLWFSLLLLAAAGLPALRAQSGPESISLTVGKSIVIDYPTDIGRISTSNPEIVDASPVTSREVLIHGKSFGTVTLVVWSKEGQRNFYNITVEANLEPLRKLLKDTFPSENIRVQSSRDAISLNGRVSGKDVSDRVMALSVPFGKAVVNNLEVAAPPMEKQILLRVKFAQLDRQASTQFAVNLVSTGAGNTIARTTTGQFPAPSVQTVSPPSGGSGSNGQFTITDALNIFAFRPDLNLALLLKALQSRSLLEILAEPNLVTTNGKEASFVVGGEFPIPVLQGGGNSGAVTIQYREFGVRLTFLPIITENKTIRMHVKPEVSSLDFGNAVTLNGFTIPALSTKKMETDIELGEGQTFVIAGLIDNQVTESFSKVPGLASIPILGQLFKSRNENRSRTELVVMVTPEITLPLLPGDPKPNIAFPKEFLRPINPSQPAPVEAPRGKSGSKRQK